jgi:hypothetical protein
MSQSTGFSQSISKRSFSALPLRAACLWLPLLSSAALFAQSTPAPPTSTPPGKSDAQHTAEIERRLNEVTNALDQTQQTLEQSLREIQRLRAELAALRAQATSGSATPAAAIEATTTPSATPSAVSTSAAPQDDIKVLQEQQEIQQAEIQQHEQSKVETVSKYPLRISGLFLFNAFSNAGVVDNTDLPTLALTRFPGASHGSAGANLRQTILALHVTGPKIGGAQSSAEMSVDFFGGIVTNSSGYSYSAGSLRMRQSHTDLDWKKTTLQIGYTEPLIAALSPTSYASVAAPALSASGNLWTWSPQLRVEHRLSLSEHHQIGLEGGLIYPETPGYSSFQLDSPIEASRRPGYEGRISYRANADTPHPFVLGVGAYSGSQFYNSTTKIRAWAVTGDWQIPLLKWLNLTGEAYRGRAIGGLGGGAYKDVLMGTDPVTAANKTVGADTAGGWSQLKVRFAQTLEANAMFGLDNVFASNFREITLPSTASPLQSYARTSSVAGNLIFRPKTYLILSPEYRRIQSWRYSGSPNVANIFTISAGYQF